MKNYLSKMKGQTTSPPRLPLAEVMWSWLGGFLGLTLVAWMSTTQMIPGFGQLFLIGSFGASAVLIYGIPDVAAAQPRSLVGGHVISALIGVAFFKYLSIPPVFLAALTVSTAMAVMHLTKTTHPPGGATALIAVFGGKNIHDLGFSFAFMPVFIGAIILLLVALAINNLSHRRHYPVYWR